MIVYSLLMCAGEEDKSVVGAHNKYVTLVESYANKMLELRGRVTRNRGDDQFRITKLDYEQMQVHTLQLERQLQGVLAEIMAWKVSSLSERKQTRLRVSINDYWNQTHH